MTTQSISPAGSSATTLMDAARELGDERVDAAIATYQERTISANRVIGLSLAVAWVLLWYWLGPGEPRTPRHWNFPQTIRLLPFLGPMLVLSTVWWLSLKFDWIEQRPWTDAVGALANFFGVGLMLHQAWDLMIATIIFLPQACITIGARYGRKAFYSSIALSVAIVQFASPANYWPNRPHFALFAIVLVVVLPLSVIRLLNTIRIVSEEAIRSRNAQSRFIATMSHELRTPLNSVINSAELIETENMDLSQRQLVQSLASNALALRNRVNEVLDVREIEAGRLAIMREPFTFSGVLKIVESVIGPQAAAKHITISFRSDGVSHMVLRSDPGRIEQILTNLAANAVKFTPEGGNIEVRVSASGYTAEGSALIECKVTDSGVGVPDADKERIFEPFWQGSIGAARNQEGVGLGLYVVRSVSDMLGAKIFVDDNPGGGSIFTWTAAIERAAPHEVPSQIFDVRLAFSEHRRTVPPMRCLVVDDNPSNRDVIGRILRRAGHRMVAATTGEAGIREAESNRFEIIFLDLHMPVLSGWDFLERFQSHLGGLSIRSRVVVISADASPTAIETAKRMGAVGYLLKPISLGKLLAILAEVRSMSEIGADVPHSFALAAADAPGMSFPLDYLRAEGEDEAIQAFMGHCVAGINRNLAMLCACLRDDDPRGALHQLHSLRNEFMNIGFEEGIAACAELHASLSQGTGEVELTKLRALASRAVLELLPHGRDAARDEMLEVGP